MARLVRIPAVLAFAALWAAGSYALGFLVLADRMGIALGAAFIGGVVTAVTTGGLTGKVWPILLGIPLAIGAMTTSVYLAGIHDLEGRPRHRVVVASEQCVEGANQSTGTCDRHAYTFTDPAGRPMPAKLDLADARGPGQDVGTVLDVYELSPGTIKIWPAAAVEPQHGIRTAATIVVPAFALYVVILGIAGALSQLAYRRRFRRHMMTGPTRSTGRSW